MTGRLSYCLLRFHSLRSTPFHILEAIFVISIDCECVCVALCHVQDTVAPRIDTTLGMVTAGRSRRRSRSPGSLDIDKTYMQPRSRSPRLHTLNTSSNPPDSGSSPSSGLSRRLSRSPGRSPVTRVSIAEDAVQESEEDRGFPMDFFVEAAKAAPALKSVTSMPAMLAPRDRTPAGPQSVKIPSTPTGTSHQSTSSSRYQAVSASVATQGSPGGPRWLSASRSMIGSVPVLNLDTSALAASGSSVQRVPSSRSLATLGSRHADDDVIHEAFASSAVRGVRLHAGVSHSAV